MYGVKCLFSNRSKRLKRKSNPNCLSNSSSVSTNLKSATKRIQNPKLAEAPIAVRRHKILFYFFASRDAIPLKTTALDTHSFSVDGVHSKQQGRDQARSPILEHTAHSQEEDTHAGMKDNVEEVVRGGAQLAEEVVQSESENREWPVRFVAAFLCGEEKK